MNAWDYLVIGACVALAVFFSWCAVSALLHPVKWQGEE